MIIMQVCTNPGLRLLDLEKVPCLDDILMKKLFLTFFFSFQDLEAYKLFEKGGK